MEEKKKEFLQIDGSMLEGGGQLFRMSMALAYLMKRPIIISKIRAKRDKGGGLGNQHLAGLNALKYLTGCSVEGDKKKSTEVRIIPSSSPISLQKMTVDCKTVGSVLLILQILLPLLLTAPHSIKLTIKGGTHVAYSPMSASAQFVLLPLLKRMGVKAEFSLKYFGLFPDMIGLIEFISPGAGAGLQAIQLLQKGSVTRLTYHLVYTDNELQFSEQFKEVLKERTKSLTIESKGMSEDMVKVGFKKKARCFTINAVFETSNECYFAVSRLYDSKELHNPEKQANQFMEEVERAVSDPDLCIDEHHADQVREIAYSLILVYMAMANGVSKLKVKNPVTLHFKTMISLLRIICNDIQIRIIREEKEEEKKEKKEKTEKDEEMKQEAENEETTADELTKLTQQEEALLDRKEGYVRIEIEGLRLIKPAEKKED